MLPILLLAGLTLVPVGTEAPVLDARVADIDADGIEDIVAVTREALLLLRGGAPPVVRRPAAPLTVVGRGLLAVVREGRAFRVTDPFGAWTEERTGARTLLGELGRGPPALLASPGDLDGDGADDLVLGAREGFHTPAGLLPVRPEAHLEILRNETFAVEYSLPVPVVGNWSGAGRELVFLVRDSIVAYHGTRRTQEIALPLANRGKESASIRRNHVLLRDVDGDGRLDLLVVMARGATGLFSAFEATAQLFAGGRVYDSERNGFFRPASFLKIAGALLAPALVDLDGDGDLDLVLSTLDTSILASASGKAPATYLLFRYGADGYERQPAWTLRGLVPLTAFKDRPEPPVTFLPDLDGDGRPEALSCDGEVRLLVGDGTGGFAEAGREAFAATGRAAVGGSIAVVPGEHGLLVARRAP